MFQSPPTRSFLRETNAFDDPHVKKPKLQYPAAIWHYKTASLVGISCGWRPCHEHIQWCAIVAAEGPGDLWSWTEICCRKPLGSFKLEHRSQLMNLGIFIYSILFNILFFIFMIQSEIDIVFWKVSKIADPSAIQKLCKSGVMGSSLIELPGSWQLGKWTKPGPGWKHFEGFTKGSVSQFVVIRKSKITQLYRLYRNIYIYVYILYISLSWNVPLFYKGYIYICIYIYIMYIYICIYIHFLWVIYPLKYLAHTYPRTSSLNFGCR